MPTIFVFDAYGTLFDVHSAAARFKQEIGPQWARLSEVWRAKHLEYSWVHALARRHVSFWVLAERSLAFAAASIGGLAPGTQEKLLGAYLTLSAFPEVPAMLDRLKAAGTKCAILTNGDPDMIAAALTSSGLTGRFDAVLTVHEAGVFKPDPAVYRLVTDRFGVAPADVSFQSSNRWDIAGAKAAGFRTVWINRTGAFDEYPELGADRIVADLAGLTA
jgi:2-haloacid dehalogenase